jgi:hypothetical protein
VSSSYIIIIIIIIAHHHHLIHIIIIMVNCSCTKSKICGDIIEGLCIVVLTAVALFARPQTISVQVSLSGFDACASAFDADSSCTVIAGNVIKAGPAEAGLTLVECTDGSYNGNFQDTVYHTPRVQTTSVDNQHVWWQFETNDLHGPGNLYDQIVSFSLYCDCNQFPTAIDTQAGTGAGTILDDDPYDKSCQCVYGNRYQMSNAYYKASATYLSGVTGASLSRAYRLTLSYENWVSIITAHNGTGNIGATADLITARTLPCSDGNTITVLPKPIEMVATTFDQLGTNDPNVAPITPFEARLGMTIDQSYVVTPTRCRCNHDEELPILTRAVTALGAAYVIVRVFHLFTCNRFKPGAGKDE